MWSLGTTQVLFVKLKGVGWGVVGGGGSGISAEHFLYNENNLTNCSTRRNSPPIPHSPPPPSSSQHHYITISKPWVQSKSSLSRMEARHREGGGEDKTEAEGVDPRLGLLLSSFNVRTQLSVCVCGSTGTSACLLVEKTAEILQDYWSGRVYTALDPIPIPVRHKGPAGGLRSSREMPKQVHTAVRRALCGRWPAEYNQRSL